MPSISKANAPNVDTMGPLTCHHDTFDGYLVSFAHFHEDADATEVFRGLPDDRCQSPHWGYVISGRVTFRYADREETFEAGDAYYAPPGHVPLVESGTEVVEFSDAEKYARTEAAIARNLAALMSDS
jgi:hypothetical protein